MKYTNSLILKKGSIIEYPKEGTNGQNRGRFSNADCHNNFIWVFKSLSVFQSLSLLSVTLYMKDLFKNAMQYSLFSSIVLHKRCFQLTVHAVANHRYIVPLQINIWLPLNMHDLKLDCPFQSFQVSWSYHANGRYRKLR